MDGVCLIASLINGEEDFNEVGEVINSVLDKRLKMVARDLVVYGRLYQRTVSSRTYQVKYQTLLLRATIIIRKKLVQIQKSIRFCVMKADD